MPARTTDKLRFEIGQSFVEQKLLKKQTETSFIKTIEAVMNKK